ncbi:MAG: FHA domain-containing protein [Rhizobiaceae bacterium]|nr:FHA domain-containing protein [Rhizobiaceae bacterium]
MITAKFTGGVFALSRHITSFALLVTVIASFAFVMPASAQEMQMQMQCEAGTATETSEVVCDFRFSQPQRLDNLVFTANEKVLDGAVFTPYSGTGSTSAMLFLVDISDPKRSATVKRNIDIVRDQLRLSSASRLVGLATFASDLELIYKPAESHNSVESTLSGIVANGAATELFSNSLEGIKILKDVKADRRALIIMSDGIAEDKAYIAQDVVTAAKEAGVTIISLGFAEAQSATPELQFIQRIAEETGGYYDYVVAAQPFPEDFLADLPRYIENGGSIKAPLQDISGSVNITLVANILGGKTLRVTDTVEVAAAAPVVEKEPTLIVKIYSAFNGIVPGASSWAENNNLLAYLLLAILPLILLAAIVIAQMRKTEDEGTENGPVDDIEDVDSVDGGEIETIGDPEEFEPTDDDGATRAVITSEPETFGHFEIVGSEENKYPIPGHSVSIGRHSDNDIQLTNNSVHRHHAHFHISPDGVPTIHDLDTANGVLVNGNLVKKMDLKAGDIIELGEVRLRYTP